jgi:glycosyltransferase involved in cell wall biosynthesis
LAVISQLAPIDLKTLPERPTVAILMSNFNYGAYIRQAIQSVVGQTYQKFELIICDDGSTDNSRDILAESATKDSRIRVIEKVNGGQASAWNAAFAASSGDLIFFLDSDDRFCPTKIATMIKAYQQSPDAGFGIHRVQRINRQGRPRGVWPIATELASGWQGERMLKEGGVLSYMPPASGLSLHRTVAERIFPLPESYPLTSVADQLVTRLAPLLTSVVNSREILTEHRLHGTNSYGRSKITAEFMLREITICENLWKAQHTFLHNLSPESASRLQPVESSSYLIYLEYLYARLSRSPSLSSYQRYMRDIQSNPRARIVWFWKYSIHLPAFLFDGLINLMCNQSLFKEIISRIRSTA